MTVERTEKLRKRGKNIWAVKGSISIPNLKNDVDVVIGG